MRLEKSIKNIKTAMIYQIVILLITFVDRKLFLSILGVDYLGLNGLFTNIITMLSLAELGVGTAIIYNLYVPLEKNDKKEVAALMQLYKKVYYMIGLAIGIIGMALMLFLPFVIKEPIYQMGYVRLVYMIFLAGTVLTYFTGHKRSLLYADQKNYILLLGDITANTIGVIVKIAVLVFWKNYIAYVIVHMIFKLIPNIWASYKVDQLYAYIKEIPTKLPLDKLEKVKDNIKDLFVHNIAHFVVTSTDNLIISSFIGLSAVGFVANYNMIIGALMGFVAQGIEGLQASMGNLVAVESKEKIEGVYDRLTFVTFWIGSFCAVALVTLIQPFIGLWLGNEYAIDNTIVFFIILNFFLWVLTRPLWQMLSVSGLFKADKINAVTEMAVNFILSMVLVQKWGVAGVLMGTTISYLVAWAMKSHLLYTKFLNKSPMRYYGKIGLYLGLTLSEVCMTYKLSRMINVNNSYIKFGIQMILCAVLPNLINMIIFRRTDEFKYFMKLMGGVGMEIIEKLRRAKMAEGIQKLVFITMITLLMLSPLELTTIPKLMLVGKLSARLVFAVSGTYIFYLLVISDIWSKQTKKMIGSYIIIGLAVILLLFMIKETESAKVTMKMILVFNTGLACAYIDYKKIGKWIYILDLSFLAYILTTIWHYMKLDSKPAAYSFLFNNANYLGLVAVLMIFICFLAYGITNSKRYFVYIIPFIWMIMISKSRTSLLALIAAVGTYLLWQLITKKIGIYYAFFALIIAGIMIVTVVYPNMDKLAIGKVVISPVKQTMGKQVFTGREKLWIEAIDLIKEKPFMGYGMDATLEGLTGGYLSTHNVYLQLLLQGGLVALLPFLFLIGYIWKSLYKVRESKLARVGAMCLIGILVIATFELLLLEKIVSLGTIQWFIIGVGLSPALYNNKETKDIKEMD